MLKRTIVAATALVASFVVFQPIEQSDARVNVHIGVGGPGYYNPGYYQPYPHYRPAPVYVPRPRYVNRCSRARRSIRNRGYYRIRAVDCSGSRYTFHAKRSGIWYRLRVRASSGRIYKVTYL